MQYTVAFLLAMNVGSALAEPQAKGAPKAAGGGSGAYSQNQPCSPLELVIARATTEAPGIGITGAPLLKAVQQLVPGTTAYALNFPSDWSSTSPGVGAQDVIRYFNEKPKAYPSQKYVLSGYSQGCVVVHQAAPKLDKFILRDKIIATATFGDPGQQATKAKAGSSPGGNAPIWPDELFGQDQVQLQ